MATSEEIAWAAGLFEGEGTFSFSQQRARASMASTDIDVLERFRGIVGVGGIGAVSPRKPHHKPAWQWWANGADAEAVFNAFAPWLGERRRKRGGEVISARQRAMRNLTYERTCSYCGLSFRPRSTRSASKVRYCSPSCLNEAKDSRRRVRRAMEARA